MTTVGMHVGQLLQPVPGGIGTYVRALLEHIPEHDITVSAFAAGRAPSGLAVPYTDLGWPRGALRYESWNRFGRPRLPIDVDVIHAPSLAIPPTRLRDGRTTAVVVTVHDVAFLRYPEYFTRRGIAFHRNGLDRARTADMIVTPSTFTREELGREGFDLQRVVAIPHGMPLAPTPSAAEVSNVLADYGLHEPFALVAGTIEPRKGIDTAIAAVSRARASHPELTLVVAGPEGWNHVHGLDAPHVRRVGQVPRTHLDALYTGALVCLVPSHYEGFGLPALEAMSRGCPVIASDATSIPEVVLDAALLAQPGDSEAWSDALIALLDDPGLRSRLANAGQVRASAFSWSLAAESHAATYRQAAAHHGSGTS